MAKVYPFHAWLPSPYEAAAVSSLPYDVMNRREARQMAEGNPLSFLRVTCADLEFGDEVSTYDPAVYVRARENWQRLGTEGVLHRDGQPAFYLYSMVMDGRRQTGIVACASVEDYRSGAVRRHELTRQVKEDDRTSHILSTGAQTGPVFLAYRDEPQLAAVMEQTMAQEAPLFDFTTADGGIRHTGWRIPAAAAGTVQDVFAGVPVLYIADGHHRAASAARVAGKLDNAGESGRFLAVIFPQSHLRILAYNRVVRSLNGMTPAAFIEKLRGIGEVLPDAPAVPAAAGEVSFYLEGKWRTLRFTTRHPEDPIADLDVSLLQEQVLSPLLDIADPRTSKNIDFVGGIRGTAELEQRVDGGGCAAAFSMYPTSLEQLMRVADANGIMPPKSTWFEPKLRDGLFTHSLEL